MVTEMALALPSNEPDTTLRLSARVLEALNNPIRRESLRLIHRDSLPRSAVGLAGAISEPATTISWHLRKLVRVEILELERVRPFKGFEEKFFSSRVGQHALILAILDETKDDDTAVRV